MRKKLLSILALLCLTVSSAWAGTQATGYFESCTAYHGSIRVKGWAYDPDQPATSIQVHAYIWYGSSVGTTNDDRMPAVGINANIERSDVNEAKGITGAHGFDQYIAVPAGTYTVQVFAIDKTGDGNPKIPGTSGNPATYTVTVTDPYNITYDANGGSGAPDAQQKSEKININLSAAKPTRDGYVFKEWNTAQDGSGISYAPGAAYTADGDATLYAQWLKIDASGNCGTTGHESDVTWTLTSDGVMTISGTGAMADYSMYDRPWTAKRNSITSIVVAEGVTHIGNNAFVSCTKATSIGLPSSLISIGDNAFQSCNNASLTSITIPANVTSIGANAFASCAKLEAINIPASVTTIGASAFHLCNALTSINVDANNNSYASEDGVLFNKDKTELIKYPKGKSGSNYTIPSSVTTIVMQAFYQCSNLEAITIPTSVTSIGDNAFYGCSKLEEINIPENVQTIGIYAFSNCTKATSISLPTNLTSIGNYAFNGCSSLTSVIIPGNLTTISNYAFKGCSSLTTVTINNGVETIGENAFESCSKLETVTIGNSVVTIGNNAFKSCSLLSSVNIPNSVETIGNSAFHTCSTLSSVDIPNSVTSIGNFAFYNCSKLETVTIGSGVTSIGNNAFSGCSLLSSVAIPNSVTSIGNSAFYKCSNLGTVNIGNSVTTIGDNAFNGCSSLTSISIPASVTSIDYNAFYGCSSLASVTLNSNPFIDEDAFDGIAAGAAVTMNLTANAAGGANWLTFYNKLYNFEADANTQVFKAELSGTTITMHEVTDKIVDAGTAVVLKSTGDPVMTLTTEASTNANANSLEGVSDAAGLTAADPSTTFVLNNGTNGVGFYKLKAGKTLGVGKAYLTYDSSTAPSFLGFDETTGMNDVRCKTEDVRGEYYNLNGQRVAQPTKGLYIVNGKKVVIK